MKTGIIIVIALFVCVASRPQRFANLDSSKIIKPDYKTSLTNMQARDIQNMLSVPRISKAKQAILLSSMGKLRKIKHHRNRRIRMDILAAKRAAMNRQYIRNLDVKRKRTRKQLPDLTLSIVHGVDNMNNQKNKEKLQHFYKKILCQQSKRHKFCR